MFLLFVLFIYEATFVTANVSDIEFKCGRQHIRSGRIVGGDDAYDGEFPWLVSISLYGRHFCGGTVIAKHWILTAGHCVQRFGVSSYRVRLGEYKMGQIGMDHKPVTLRVDRIVLHPNFSSPVRFYNDIALVRVQKEIVYDNYCSPICLPNPEDNYTGINKGIVAGWGYLQELNKGGTSSVTLQKVVLPIYNYDICQSWYREAGKNVLFQDSQMCAGFKDGGKDSCQGDSGGPLIAKRKGDRYVQIGIVSAGIGCAQPLLPGLYTRVQPYLPWIRSQIDVS